MLLIVALLTCVQFLSLVKGENFYNNDPNIIELTPSNFDEVVHRTNYTSLIEFYAPWCGYCQQLKGTMKNAAKVLDGIVQVAAVNCDESINKNLCAQHRITSFPSLMVFRPPKLDLDVPYNERGGSRHHASELYAGERKLKPIVDFAQSRVKNYVTRLNNADKLSKALSSGRSQYAMVLFSKKEKLPTVYKSVVVDWLGVLDAYMISNKKLDAISTIDIEQLPRISAFLKEINTKADKDSSLLVVFDRENDDYHVYGGNSFEKEELFTFLNSFGYPNEGPFTDRDKFLSTMKGTTTKKSQKSQKSQKSKKSQKPQKSQKQQKTSSNNTESSVLEQDEL